MPRYPFESRYRPGMMFAVILGVLGIGLLVIALLSGRFDDESPQTTTAPPAIETQAPPPADGSEAP